MLFDLSIYEIGNSMLALYTIIALSTAYLVKNYG